MIVDVDMDDGHDLDKLKVMTVMTVMTFTCRIVGSLRPSMPSRLLYQLPCFDRDALA